MIEDIRERVMIYAELTKVTVVKRKKTQRSNVYREENFVDLLIARKRSIDIEIERMKMIDVSLLRNNYHLYIALMTLTKRIERVMRIVASKIVNVQTIR